MNLVLIILLIVLLFGGVSTAPWYPWSAGWGYGPSGLAMILVVVLLVILLAGGRV